MWEDKKMNGVFNQIIGFLLNIFIIIICVIAVVAVPIFIVGLFYFLWRIILKKDRLQKRTLPIIEFKKYSIATRLFLLFPLRFVDDLFNRNPDHFTHHGLHIFCGEQGCGKTIAMLHFAKKIHCQYPLAQVRANFQVDFANEQIQSIDDIIFKNNGELGQINLIDEIQTWFNSLESKNFPIEMIQEICQQRKQRKIILGTSQVFNRVAKAIREQTLLMYEPHTIMKCLTIVSVYKPLLDESGSVLSKKRVKMYFFVHNDELRNCYDTYEKIERLNKVGFKDVSNQINNRNTFNFIQENKR